MIQIIRIIAAVFFLFTMSCGETKKQDVKKEASEKTADATSSKETTEKSESTTDDLVYEGVGISLLKMEPTARSQAELKGRVEIIQALREDAVLLMKDFSTLQKDLFANNFNADAFEKSLNEYFSKETIQLKGSSVSEYRRSEKQDTTFAYMEMPLMAGYEVIETAIVSVGVKSDFLKANAVDAFKKNFHEFFMAEKKKLLTKPA